MQIIINTNTVTIIAALAAVVAAIISFFNLREMKYARIESSRAIIVVSFVYLKEINDWEILIKNYGLSSGVLKYIHVNPSLTQDNLAICEHPLTEITNLFLAPGQQLSSYFPFSKHPAKQFNVTVCYETLGKKYSDSYKIDLTFYDNVGYTIFSDRKSAPSREDLLGEIATNIAWLSRKF